MPNVSSRAHIVPASPIRKLLPYADAAIAKGIKVHFLNIGQPDLEPPKEFWDAIHRRTSKMVEYTNSVGIPSLRKKALEFYANKGIRLEESQLIVTTAGSEALIFALMACLNPGDEVIIPEPLYANYNGFSAMCDIKVVPIPTVIEDNFALPPAEAFAERITPKTKAILICNPNNPTGTVYDRAQLEALRDLAIKHDLFIFADEVYEVFNYTGQSVPSVLELEGLEMHAVRVDSVSKRFSLCGARIGFLMSRNPEIMTAATRFAQARLSVPVLEQVGVEACLGVSPEYFDAIRTEYTHRRDVLTTELRKIPGVVVPEIHGAFYAMVQLPIDDCDRFCQWMLEEFQYKGQSVMMAPGTGFYATPGKGKNQVRIAYVVKSEDIVAAMECLGEALKVYPGRTEVMVAATR